MHNLGLKGLKQEVKDVGLLGVMGIMVLKRLASELTSWRGLSGQSPDSSLDSTRVASESGF